MGRDGKVIEGLRNKIEGQVPMFDVTTRSGQTHTFRINSIAVQSRLTCSLDNQNIDKEALGEHGAWISAIKRAAGLAARKVHETKAVTTVAVSSEPHIQTLATEQRRDEQGGQGLEQHYAPSVGLHVRQEAGHRLPSRLQNKRRVNHPQSDQSQEAVESQRYVSTFVACTQEHGPAERAGLEIDDELVEVDSRNIEKMEWPSVLALLEAGPAGTNVRVLGCDTLGCDTLGCDTRPSRTCPLNHTHNAYNRIKPDSTDGAILFTYRHQRVSDNQEAGSSKGRGSPDLGLHHSSPIRIPTPAALHSAREWLGRRRSPLPSALRQHRGAQFQGSRRS